MPAICPNSLGLVLKRIRRSKKEAIFEVIVWVGENRSQEQFLSPEHTKNIKAMRYKAGFQSFSRIEYRASMPGVELLSTSLR